MSEFLLIIPDGWFEANLVPILETVSEQDLVYYTGAELSTVQTWLEDTLQLPFTGTVTKARVFKDGELLRLWYTLEVT